MKRVAGNIRPRQPESERNAKRGFFDRALRWVEGDSKRVRFKDRGSDESEWRGKEPPLVDSMTQRLKKLQNSALAIVEDSPPESGEIRPNPSGLKKGYDPYDSGRLAKTAASRRRDLRRLSEWVALCKQAKRGPTR